MKNLCACMCLVLVLCLSCTFHKPLTREESSKIHERRIMWQLQRQLNHDRIVADCQKYGNCKNNYKIYNK
jgi:hypothetical protein